MTYMHHGLRSALIAAFLAGVVGNATGSAAQVLVEETLAAIRDCMAKSPAPWPEPWQQEYVDTIREAIVSHQDASQYAVRLRILRDGFPPCWEGSKKGEDRSLFEVHRAQIRWYIESLMSAELPGDNEKQRLRDQYKDLLNYTGAALVIQFPFLDPNVVQAAKVDYLTECYRGIETPLLPIFLHPFSEGQVELIRQRWHDLRYARVDLWHQLGGDAATSGPDQGAASIKTHPHYLLTQRSLSQLRPHIWAIIAPAPDYYRSAVSREIDAQRRRLQSRSDARTQESRLGLAVLQTEYLSFLLAALLETAEDVPSEQGNAIKESRVPVPKP